MKRIAGILLLMISAGMIQAQNSWKVVLHNKVVLTASTVSEEKNVRLVKSTDWKKNGYLEVEFKEEPASGWQHTIQFLDEKDLERWSRDSVTSVKISTSILRKLYAGRKQVKIVMMISPPNPMMMAPTRLLHLATLKLP